MKIKMKEHVSSGNRIYQPEEIVDIAPDKAEEFIRKGFAVLWEEKVIEVSPTANEQSKNAIVMVKKGMKKK